MDIRLLFQALMKYTLGLLLVGLLLFLPANTIQYWNGWLFIGLLFIPMFIVGIILFFKSPDLLRSRLSAKEKEQGQKEIVIYSGIMFILGFVLSGLNFKYHWIILPNIVVIIASIIFTINYLLYAEVLRENAFLSRTIKVTENQKLIDTGLYSIVRHPMYSVTILLFLMIPLILGSILSFLLFLMYPFILTKRIKMEEVVLEKELKGYKEYQKKVRYKLIPYIW